MSIKSEILDIAKDNGYEGAAQTITGAINALADTLAGEDVAGGRTVASAIHAIGPYIGGGGGTSLGAVVSMSIVEYDSEEGGYVSDGQHMWFAGDTEPTIEQAKGAEQYPCMFSVWAEGVNVPSGLYVLTSTRSASSRVGSIMLDGRPFTDYETDLTESEGGNYVYFHIDKLEQTGGSNHQLQIRLA